MSEASFIVFVVSIFAAEAVGAPWRMRTAAKPYAATTRNRRGEDEEEGVDVEVLKPLRGGLAAARVVVGAIIDEWRAFAVVGVCVSDMSGCRAARRGLCLLVVVLGGGGASAGTGGRVGFVCTL